jgi:hypothetical protein
MDQKRFRKKVWLKLAVNPATLLPFLLGATGLSFSWATNQGGLAMFIGLVLLLGSAGVFFTRIILGSEKAAKEALAELEAEAAAERDRYLRDLYDRLCCDEDRRTERLLLELKEAMEKFREHGWIRLNTASKIGILDTVERLYQGCISSLERSLELYGKLETMTGAARKMIKAQREGVIEDVRLSVEKINALVAEIEKLAIGEKGDSELARLREELDTSLEVARRSEARVREMFGDASKEK